MRFTIPSFTTRDVEVETSRQVKAQLADTRSCMVVGQPGAGKTHAVRQAVKGAVWLNVHEGPTQRTRFVLDLARQLDSSAQILNSYTTHGFESALERATGLLADRCLVVDNAHLLDSNDINPHQDDGFTSVWRARDDILKGWLKARFDAGLTVLISPHPVRDFDAQPLRHEPPATWPIKFEHTPDGYRDWQRLAERVDNRPAGFVLGRALSSFASAHTFASVLDELAWHEATPTMALHQLATAVLHALPETWRRVLSWVKAVPGVPHDNLSRVTDRDSHAALSGLLQLDLLQRDERGRLELASILTRHVTSPSDTADVLASLARDLIDSVNDPASLRAVDAERIFMAHRIYVDTGDFTRALETARIHGAGLVELAYQTSRSGRWPEAFQQYGRIRDMLTEHTPRDETDRRIHSYVHHYYGYHGVRTKRLPTNAVTEAYREAIQLWPVNALWHSRLISFLIHLGQREEARAALNAAYTSVPQHPRQHTMLRILPAEVALEQSDLPLVLELLEPVFSLSGEIDPDGRYKLKELCDALAEGLEVTNIYSRSSALIFNQPTPASILCLEPDTPLWRATLPQLQIVSQSRSAREALSAAVDRLSAEALRLAQSPTHRLSKEERVRKSLIIGRVDLLNSDIGLSFAEERWLIGEIQGAHFDVRGERFERLSIPAPLQSTFPDEPRGLYFARVKTRRDGYPSELLELKPAGSGHSLRELFETARRLGTKAS